MIIDYTNNYGELKKQFEDDTGLSLDDKDNIPTYIQYVQSVYLDMGQQNLVYIMKKIKLGNKSKE